MELRQYKIVLIRLDPATGSEIKKTRPYLIVSPNEMNKYLSTIVVAPLTTNLRNLPSRVFIHTNGKKAMIILDQIGTIDRQRVLKEFDSLNNTDIQRCKNVIREIFVD